VVQNNKLFRWRNTKLVMIRKFSFLRFPKTILSLQKGLIWLLPRIGNPVAQGT